VEVDLQAVKGPSDPQPVSGAYRYESTPGAGGKGPPQNNVIIDLA